MQDDTIADNKNTTFQLLRKNLKLFYCLNFTYHQTVVGSYFLSHHTVVGGILSLLLYGYDFSVAEKERRETSHSCSTTIQTGLLIFW